MDPESEVHLRAIRKALAQGNAAVMIGSGFSMNAEGGHQLASWKGLAEALRAELDPKRRWSSDTPVLQLGEQYVRVFSRPALEELLKQHVPDEKVNPGAIHQQLLSLPWSEIFTTNYDTLLERAADEIVDPAHYAVLCREDIPQSKVAGRRRIVKLHGSFPSQRPFVFTEEDYRTYPSKFAPFVNTVRQALLENVFCLVGFSGDDPNFLHWIGWVRDMLDTHALPIYFFVSEMPPFGQKKLLEARRIIPVVLPQTSDEERGEYKDRYTELFRKLSEPIAAPPQKWGSIDSHHVQAPASSKEDRFDQVIEYYVALNNLRKTYPGWIIAPSEVRQRLAYAGNRSHGTLSDKWVQERLFQQSPAFVVAVAREYLWHQSTTLQPIEDAAGTGVLNALKAPAIFELGELPEVDRMRLGSLGIIEKGDFKAAWLETAQGILEWARQESFSDVFTELAALIRSHFRDDQQVSDEITYQAILLELYRGEFGAARNILQSWEPSVGEPFTMVKKGSLLTEVNEPDAGLANCLEGIKLIRRALKSSPESLQLLSQEAWACVIAKNIVRAREFLRFSLEPEPGTSDHVNSLGKRLADIASKGYDVGTEQQNILCGVNAESGHPSTAVVRVPSFDLGKSTTSYRLGMSSDLSTKLEACFSWFSFADRIALLPRTGNVSFFASTYAQAAWWVRDFDQMRRVTGVLLRTQSSELLKPYDSTKPRFRTGWFSRVQIARLTPHGARILCERSLAELDRAIRDSAGRDSAESACRFQLELLSRLIIRLDVENDVLNFLHGLVALHKTSQFQKLPNTWGLMASALSRCFENLAESGHLDAAEAVISIPQLLADVPDHYAREWLPLHSFRIRHRSPNKKLQASPALEEDASNSLDALWSMIQKGLVNSPQIGPLWQRLTWVALNFDVSEKLEARIVAAIWQGSAKWPRIPGFYATLALHFPAPKGTNARVRFKNWVLRDGLSEMSKPSTGSIRVEGRTWAIPPDNSYFDYCQEALHNGTWSKGDSRKVVMTVMQWWEHEGTSLIADSFRIERIRDALLDRLNQVDALIGALPAHSHFVWREFDAEMSNLVKDSNSIGAPMWLIRARLAESAGTRSSLTEIDQELGEALMGGTDEEMRQAVRIIGIFAKRKIISARFIPEFALQTAISMCLALETQSLSWCTNVLIYILKFQATWVSPIQARAINSFLHNIRVKTDYDSGWIGLSIPEEKAPEIRFLAMRLSYIMTQTLTAEDSDAAIQFLSISAKDPLPEIRHGDFMNDV